MSTVLPLLNQTMSPKPFSPLPLNKSEQRWRSHWFKIAFPSPVRNAAGIEIRHLRKTDIEAFPAIRNSWSTKWISFDSKGVATYECAA